MPATAIASTLSDVRDFLVDTKTRKFWSDAELKALYTLGVQDLWGAILDLHGDHYFVVDESGSVVLKSGKTFISGVPESCFRVLLIEPLDTTSAGTGRGVIFTPKKYNHPDFANARTQDSADPIGIQEVFYHMTGAGAPIEAPVIKIAPTLTSDLSLRLAYLPTIEVQDHNPIPGQSDNALKSWTIAYALGKEGSQGQRIPDAGWLSIYSTEKQSILTRLTPRQEQEAETVDDFFMGFGHL